MERQTDIANVIDISALRPDYDATCRRVLAFRQVLAHILRGCVEEYRDCSLEEIDACTGEGVQVGTAAVARDMTAASIDAAESSDKSLNEGTVVYDIRFTARVPGCEEHIELIINIEAQRLFDRRYPLHHRAQYYGARLLSSQFGTVIDPADYAGLKRVYSIWICTHLPGEYRAQRNSINIYRMAEEGLVGNPFGSGRWRDLIRVVLVCLGDADEAENLLRLLGVLLEKGRSADEKKQILSREFGIAITENFDTEVTAMCNLSEGIFEDGMQKGREEGMQKGREEGMQKGREEGQLTSIRALMSSLACSAERAMDFLQIPAESRKMLLEKL